MNGDFEGLEGFDDLQYRQELLVSALSKATSLNTEIEAQRTKMKKFKSDLERKTIKKYTYDGTTKERHWAADSYIKKPPGGRSGKDKSRPFFIGAKNNHPTAKQKEMNQTRLTKEEESLRQAMAIDSNKGAYEFYMSHLTDFEA